MRNPNTYYNYYLFNIYTLINKYNLEYKWLSIGEIKFFNGSNSILFHDFTFPDKFLIDCQNNKKLLGEDILNRGTFTPFFYSQNSKGENFLMLGKHRYYSLMLCNYYNPISKKFLFIKVPTWGPKGKNIEEIHSKLFYWDFKMDCDILYPKWNGDINYLLLKTGDALSRLLYNSNIIPFPPFNDEKLFEEWLNGPEPIID